MAYGQVGDVEALTKRYTSQGSFTSSTTPTDTQVNGWLEDLSAIADVTLETNGFDTPVTTPNTVVHLLERMVTNWAVELVHLANSGGRFYDQKRGGMTKDPFSAFDEFFSKWLRRHAPGLERLGLSRTHDVTDGIGSRETDESGDTVHPIFQREGFGETYRNWDS